MIKFCFISVFLILLFSISFVSAMTPGISFVDPTPATGTSTSSNSSIINISITNVTSFSTFVWNWNGTNYTFYNSSLILMMNFDNVSDIGETSTKVRDSSIYGNNGTCSSCPFWNTSGKYGGAYQFTNANSHYWDAGKASVLNDLTAATWSAWVKPTTGRAIFYKADGNTVDAGWWIDIRNTNDIGITIERSSVNLRRYVDYVPNNQWIHVAVTWNGTFNASAVKIYLNGTERVYTTSDNGSGSHGSDASYDFNIGYGGGGSSGYFNGEIDEPRVWNRVLSDAEIRQLYYSNLNQYSNTSWGFYTNQSNLSGDYTYMAYAIDTSNNLNQTDLRSLTVTSSSSSSSSSSSGGGASVPEFSDYAMMGILIIGISGFFAMRKRD